MTLYRDRADAAADLVRHLPPELGRDWVVLALPRGGVPVAAPIAQALDAPLDLMIVRKLGAPGNPELAVGAVYGPGRDQRVLNPDLVRLLGLSDPEIDRLAQAQADEIARRRRLWGRDSGGIALRERDVLIVDDGLATGATLRAAIAAAQQAGARQVGVALPVALSDSLETLPAGLSPLICPHPAAGFSAIGAAYDSFPQVSDAEVARLIGQTGPDGRFAKP